MRNNLPDSYRIALDLAVGLGLRQGEVSGLSATDVDFLVEMRTYTHPLPSSDSEREVPSMLHSRSTAPYPEATNGGPNFGLV